MHRRLLSTLAAGLLVLFGSAAPAADPFVVKPYLQLGDAPSPNAGDLVLLWQAEDAEGDWSVEYRTGDDAPWRKAEAPSSRRIAVAEVAPHRVYRAALKRLDAGRDFSYRVRKGGEVVFESKGKARKSADQPYRFVAVGDIAQGTDEQRVMAYRMVQAKPDFVMITGDIVYARGRI